MIPNTRRVAAQASLTSDDPDLYRQLVASVVDFAMVGLDALGHVVSWNPGAERLEGYVAAEIIGQHFEVLFVPEDRAAGRPTQQLESAARTGRLEEAGWRLRKDGSRFWAHALISPIRDDRGEVIGFSHVMHDRTEGRTATATVRESEESFRLLVETVNDYAIFMLDPEGRVVSWNKGAERIKGYTAHEIIGTSFTRFYPQEAIDARFPQHELDVASIDGRFEDEGWRVRKDGSRFWANVVITALREPNGRLVGFAKVTRDLTARREAEEQARRLAAEQAARAQAQRAAAAVAEAYQDLDQFAYAASHDLKAPLRGIANLAQWIQDDVGEKLGAESLAHMALLQGRVRRMEALIDGILTYSRAGRRLSPPELVDTGALVRESIELLAVPAEMRIEICEPMPTLLAERVPLQQVFMNLLSNAVKYTRATRPDVLVRVAWRNADDAVEFDVSDNGPGIAPQYHERIWGMFQTLAARDKIEGSGIGLSVVKKIVESRGGRVSVRSTPGHGATFRFAWPRTPRAAVASD
jgi:PAS domain S-box-containing protein